MVIFAVAGEGDKEGVTETELATDPLRDLEAIHLRHADVEQDDLRVVQTGAVKGLRAIVRSRDVVAVVAKQLAQGLGRVDVVVHHEDPTARPGGYDGRGGSAVLGRRRDVYRDTDQELSAVSGAIAQRLDRTPVQLDEPANQRQADPKAAARASAGLRTLHEELERVLPQILCQAGAVVLHADDEVVAVHMGAYQDPAANVGVLGGVVQQIGEDLREPGGIGEEHHGLGRQIERNPVAALVDERARALDRLLDHGAQEERLLAKLDLPAGDARDVEEIVDQPRHVLDLSLDDLAGPRHAALLALVDAHDPQRGRHRCERIPELVAEHREKLILAPIDLRELIDLAAQGQLKHRALLALRLERGRLLL